MQYLDTSLLVAALTDEALTDTAQHWLARQPAGSMAISDWVITEFAAALSMKLRGKQIRAADRAEVLSTFTLLADESLEVWPVTRGDYRTAARFESTSGSGHPAPPRNRGRE